MKIQIDFGYRYVNLGVEFLAGNWFSGWLGAYENLAADDADPVATLGLGFRGGRFEIALSVAVSTADIQLSTGEDDKTFPNSMLAGMANLEKHAYFKAEAGATAVPKVSFE